MRLLQAKYTSDWFTAGRLTEYKLNRVISYQDAVLIRQAEGQGLSNQIYCQMLKKYANELNRYGIGPAEFWIIREGLDRDLVI